jgi:hypothetical protein
MNARMKTVGPCNTGLVVISPGMARGGSQPGRWIRFRRALGRMGLLLGSPVASYRWARATRKAIARKSEIQGPVNQSDVEADYEGVRVMGF